MPQDTKRKRRGWCSRVSSRKRGRQEKPRLKGGGAVAFLTPKFVPTGDPPDWVSLTFFRDPEPREIPVRRDIRDTYEEFIRGKTARVCSPPCSSPSEFPAQFYPWRDTPRRQLVPRLLLRFPRLDNRSIGALDCAVSGHRRLASRAIVDSKAGSLAPLTCGRLNFAFWGCVAGFESGRSQGLRKKLLFRSFAWVHIINWELITCVVLVLVYLQVCCDESSGII